jgi:holin-like protein
VIVAAVLQLAALISLNLLGRWLCATLHLPLPGNVLGMLMLFALLSLRLVRLEWFEPTARLFNRHLALFFIPLVVGLLALPGSLIRSHGLALLVIIIVTAVVGVVTTGGIATWLERQPRDEQ